MAKVVRLTTPTFIFRTEGNVDLTLAAEVHVTFSSYGVLLDKTGDDLDVSAQEISVYMSQADTYKLKPGRCEVMINWIYENGSRGSNDPEHPIIFTVDKNLLDRVIEVS